MDNWLLFWKILLIAAFTMFGVLAIVVAIGGFADIRALFRSVDAQNDSGVNPDASDNESESPSR